MTTLLTTLLIVGLIVFILGISVWFLLGVLIFLGAATMGDLHDDYPLNSDFDDYDRKKK